MTSSSSSSSSLSAETATTGTRASRTDRIIGGVAPTEEEEGITMMAENNDFRRQLFEGIQAFTDEPQQQQSATTTTTVVYPPSWLTAELQLSLLEMEGGRKVAIASSTALTNNGTEPEPSREFDCGYVEDEVDLLCTSSEANVTSIECKVFEVNVCGVSGTQRDKLCRDGYAQEFYRQFPCYCDDRCLSKLGGTVSGSIFGFSVLVGFVCVVWRKCRTPVSNDEMERRLAVPRKDKPDPRVSQRSINSFKWIPIVTCVAISVWFIVSTAIVISLNGRPQVSTFEVSYMMVSTFFMMFWLYSNMTLAINGARGLTLLKRELARTDPVVHTDTVHHIVVLPNYKEEIDLMRATIMRLVQQQYVDVKTNVTVVLAMEQGEGGYWDKGMKLREEFLPKFYDVVLTCHPRLKGEQPGKSSNMKWSYAALRRFATKSKDTSEQPLSTSVASGIAKVISGSFDDEENGQQGGGANKMADQDGNGGDGDGVTVAVAEEEIDYVQHPDRYFDHPDIIAKTKASDGFAFDPTNTVVTLMDADALSHPRFLSTLSQKFEESEGPTKHMRFWQCPVAFYENIAEVDFVNRAVTIVFAFNELANTGVIDLGLVGCNPRVPVNTYSMSWRLFDLIDGGDNFVVADESHNLFKSFHMSKGLARLDPIFLPISVYNVTDDDFFTGFKSRFTQIKRWMYGNAYEFSFWSGRYLGFSRNRSSGWPVPWLDKMPILWRLFIFSSFNLVQPLFFCLYGLSWAFYLKTPYFQTLSTVFVTCIMTTFMIINVSIFVMHWFLINELKIESVQRWPIWKKVCLTVFDAIIGVGAATIFFVYAAGLAANGQLLFSGGGLKWGTEGRAKPAHEGEDDGGGQGHLSGVGGSTNTGGDDSIRVVEGGQSSRNELEMEGLRRKKRSTRTYMHARSSVESVLGGTSDHDGGSGAEDTNHGDGGNGST